jgi:hypothetical protein
MGQCNPLATKKLIIMCFGLCGYLIINLSLGECKKSLWQGQGLVKSNNFSTACDIQSLLYEYFSADHFKMSYLMSIGQIIDIRT